MTFLKNPRLLKQDKTIYHYYAGYSDEFVEDIINSYLDLSSKEIVLDLWNGSGTTTKIAYKNNIRAYGFDINPVMKYIAKAKLVTLEDEKQLRLIMRIVLEQFNSRVHAKLRNGDLLSIWLNDRSIRIIRYLESIINDICSRHSVSRYIFSFFIVLQFRLLKSLLVPFKTSNPTWIKYKIKEVDKINIKKNDVHNRLVIIFNEMIDALINSSEINGCRRYPIILTASSYQLPLENNSIDAVITSPPYCTRIDYTVATLPELAFLGFSKEDIFSLRSAMIGSTTISNSASTIAHIPSLTVVDFLSKVKCHDSKASNSYYYKYYNKYFVQLYLSLKEITRVIKSKGRCCIVIQNSFYKDLLIPLNLIVEELMLELGFTMLKSNAFKKKSTHTNANPTSRKYRKQSVAQYEYALIFIKGESDDGSRQ